MMIGGELEAVVQLDQNNEQVLSRQLDRTSRALQGAARAIAAGRIVAIADSYEVMTAHRAYKKPMATAAARGELARCAGTQFDPTYVRAFLAIPLPKLLWAMGPGSLLMNLPLLRAAADTANKGVIATTVDILTGQTIQFSGATVLNVDAGTTTTLTGTVQTTGAGSCFAASAPVLERGLASAHRPGFGPPGTWRWGSTVVWGLM